MAGDVGDVLGESFSLMALFIKEEGAGLYLLAGALVVAGIYILWKMPTIWRNEHEYLHLSGVDGPESPLFRAWIRSGPMSLALGLGTLEMLIATFLWGSDATRWPGRAAFVFSFTVFFWLGGTASVVFFNRPKFLVPPPYRSYPGLIRDKWQRRRRV